MGATFDIFSPSISQVSKGIEGKMILLHSNERKLGKTLQATKFPKPFYLRFEQGINAISGLPYAPLTKWSDFKKVRKQLTDPKTIDKAKELYNTIIVDTLDVAIKWCDKYVCGMQGVERLNDGNSGYGLWKEYENEWFNEWSPLINAGYTIVFISHSLPQVREFCDTALWIEGGMVREYGKVDPVSDHYSKYVDYLNSLNAQQKKEENEKKFQKRLIVDKKDGFWDKLLTFFQKNL